MIVLKAKLDVVTVSRGHLLSFMNISNLSSDTWVTLIWGTKKEYAGKAEKRRNAPNSLEDVTFYYYLGIYKMTKTVMC